MNWRCWLGHKVTSVIYDCTDSVYELRECQRDGCHHMVAFENQKDRLYIVNATWLKAHMARERPKSKRMGFKVTK